MPANKTNLSKYLLYQLPAILWIVAIFIQSSISNLSVPDLGFKTQDKLAHMVEFGILAFLLRRFFVFNSRISWQKKWYLYTLIVGCCYAVFDEIHQAFVPGRWADVYDVLADVLGVLIVINIYRFLKNK
ncbi:VanZ family protein [candidate division KSB1 bacterium]|nr:VanZ family protein [candidate division KSB1 bacterium]MBL7095760.1 VanZ family protein [candidate division KSB1 bacterium]